MRSRFGFAEFVVAVFALAAMTYGFRYMVTQGLETVIASQPAPVKPSDTYASFD